MQVQLLLSQKGKFALITGLSWSLPHLLLHKHVGSDVWLIVLDQPHIDHTISRWVKQELLVKTIYQMKSHVITGLNC